MLKVEIKAEVGGAGYNSDATVYRNAIAGSFYGAGGGGGGYQKGVIAGGAGYQGIVILHYYAY